MTLASLLHPLTVSDFLLEHYGTRPVYIPGPSHRFVGFNTGQPDLSCPLLAGLIYNLEYTLDAPVCRQGVLDGQRHPLLRSEQDAFVLQLSGQAVWHLYGKTPKPTEQATWHGSLKSGDVLYLPKNWWYDSESPLPAGRSLVLGICNPTGADLLTWLTGQLKMHEVIRADIPRFAAPAVKAEYLGVLRRALEQALQSPALLEQYIRQVDETASRLKPLHFGVAWRDDLPDSHRIIIATRRYPRIRRLTDTSIYLSTTGKERPFSIVVVPVILYLLDKAPVSLGVFYKAFAQQFNRQKLCDFLAELFAKGIVAFTAPEDPC